MSNTTNATDDLDLELGFRVAGVFYEFPTRYTFGMALGVKELTGLGLREFGLEMEKLMPSDDDETPQAVEISVEMLAGLLFAAMWQRNPKTTPDQVKQIDLSNFEFVVPEPAGEDEEEEQGRPPADAANEPEVTAP